MVDIARYFLNFLADESCGKCLSCREGIQQMRGILTDITEGKGKNGDIEILERLAVTIKKASMCALGQTAPNPVLSTLRYFRDEYVAHIEKRCCPAYACRSLISYFIDPLRCKACMKCLRACPVEAIDGGKGLIHLIDQDKCTRCGSCYRVCPSRFEAVKRLSGEPVPPPLSAEERVIKKEMKG
jgi:NADH-quinone oxidoreductase subunit F